MTFIDIDKWISDIDKSCIFIGINKWIINLLISTIISLYRLMRMIFLLLYGDRRLLIRWSDVLIDIHNSTYPRSY